MMTWEPKNGGCGAEDETGKCEITFGWCRTRHSFLCLRFFVTLFLQLRRLLLSFITSDRLSNSTFRSSSPFLLNVNSPSPSNSHSMCVCVRWPRVFSFHVHRKFDSSMTANVKADCWMCPNEFSSCLLKFPNKNEAHCEIQFYIYTSTSQARFSYRSLTFTCFPVSKLHFRWSECDFIFGQILRTQNCNSKWNYVVIKRPQMTDIFKRNYTFSVTKWNSFDFRLEATRKFCRIFWQKQSL